MTAEHNAGVRRTFRKFDFGMQREVRNFLFADQEELFVGSQMDFATHDFGLSVIVRVPPCIKVLSVDE